jgi:predicted nuclease with TOPRIM domain
MAFSCNACELARKRLGNQKEGAMDAKDYCGSLVTELSGWKAKMYDVTRKLDKVSSGDKEKVVPMVNELHMILEELDDRVERLKTDCPTQWGPDKIDIEGKFHALETKWEEAWKNVSPGDIGG